LARSPSYYVHESWSDGNFTVTLHREDCIRCNHGGGEVIGSFLRRGKWHGPYRRKRAALAKAASAPPLMLRSTCACAQ
jgi:hypothetical protein